MPAFFTLATVIPALFTGVDADMLVAYYSRGAHTRELFEGLEVSRTARFEDHLNQHDVIKIDVQRIYDLSGVAVAQLGNAISARPEGAAR